ncbi:MAG: hypothetical protein KJZ86_02020 [Caldilineaceae bacterium]|nr:hypothetical protein [Caldilineaceae bacterium]
MNRLLNRVPEITIFFWIIKILATTVGETAADFLAVNLNLGLTGTSVVMGGLLIAVLLVQFLKIKRYEPASYWAAVVLMSIVGTLITDYLVDGVGIALTTTTIAFSLALIAVFVSWYLSEKTLSVHKIFTAKREFFYWAAILFTFALGTAAGDLVAESLDVGYAFSALIFAGLIGLIALVYYVVKIDAVRFLKMDAVLSFWLAYILTRPLGASIGDLLSQPVDAGGLGLGTVATSGIFLLAILALVIYLSAQQRKQTMSAKRVGALPA